MKKILLTKEARNLSQVHFQKGVEDYHCAVYLSVWKTCWYFGCSRSRFQAGRERNPVLDVPSLDHAMSTKILPVHYSFFSIFVTHGRPDSKFKLLYAPSAAQRVQYEDIVSSAV